MVIFIPLKQLLIRLERAIKLTVNEYLADEQPSSSGSSMNCSLIPCKRLVNSITFDNIILSLSHKLHRLLDFFNAKFVSCYAKILKAVPNFLNLHILEIVNVPSNECMHIHEHCVCVNFVSYSTQWWMTMMMLQCGLAGSGLA